MLVRRPKLQVDSGFSRLNSTILFLFVILFAVVVPLVESVQHRNPSVVFNPLVMGNVLLSHILIDRTLSPFMSKRPPSRLGRPMIRRRRRRSVHEVFQSMGRYCVRRACRMNEPSFWKLYKLLRPYMRKPVKPQRAPNGSVKNEVRLAIALRYFAGGSPLDIFPLYGVGCAEVYKSVWMIVDAVNLCPDLDFSFPADHQKQIELADQFQTKSRAFIDCCVGAIDCMLVWILKPPSTHCKISGFGGGKYWCGRKKKYGLCLQGTCDAFGRFLDIEIRHPA